MSVEEYVKTGPSAMAGAAAELTGIAQPGKGLPHPSDAAFVRAGLKAGGGATRAASAGQQAISPFMEDVVNMQAELMGLLKSIEMTLGETANRLFGPEPPREGNPVDSSFPPIRVADGSLGFINNRMYDLRAQMIEIGYHTMRLSKL